MKFIFMNVMSLLLLLSISSCSKKEADAESENNTKGIDVVITNPIQTRLAEFVKLNASTMFQNQEIVKAPFAGYIVKSYKNPGDYVKQGDVLFIMRTKESSAADSINIDVKIYSRTNGVLTELAMQKGNYAAEGDKLALIVEPGSLKIILNVPFQYASLLNSSAKYVFELPDGKNFIGRVVKKMPSVDPVNQTQTFIMEPVQHVELPANLNLMLKLPYKTADNAVALPKSTVISNETMTEFWVMKIVNDTTAVKVVVQKGIESDSLVQIVSPVFKTSDSFIKDGAYGLKDTTKITVSVKQ